MQRLAQRDVAPATKDGASSAPKAPADFFSKFAADSQVKAQTDADATLGAREDRPLFVTTVRGKHIY